MPVPVETVRLHCDHLNGSRLDRSPEKEQSAHRVVVASEQGRRRARRVQGARERKRKRSERERSAPSVRDDQQVPR